jgi:SAM-dependent methyltransferase
MTFSGEQFDAAYPPGIERSFWHIARNAIIRRWLRKAGMDRQRLLEIGCGRGIVVDYLRSKGIDCIGCDLAAPAVPAHLAGMVFASTDFRTLPLPTRQDIGGVLLCDVLEHLDEPALLLRALPQFLPGASSVLITVPARSELWSEWDDHFGHLRRYELNALHHELEAAGLAVVFSRYFFHALYLPMFLARRRRHATLEPPHSILLHRIIGRAMMIDESVLPAGTPGTSIIAIAAVRSPYGKERSNFNNESLV